MAKYIINKILENGTNVQGIYYGFDDLNTKFITEEMTVNHALPEITEDEKNDIIKIHMDGFGFFVGLSNEEWDEIAIRFLEKNGMKKSELNVKLLFDHFNDAYHESVKRWLPDLLDEYYVNDIDIECFEKEHMCPFCGHSFEESGVVRIEVTPLDLDESGTLVPDYFNEEVEYRCGNCKGEINLFDLGIEYR